MQLPTNQTQSVVVPVSIDYIKDLTNQALSLQEENKELKEHCRWLDAEYTKKRNQDNQNLKSALHAETKVSADLANTVQNLRSEAATNREKMRKYFTEKQEDHVTLTQAYHKLNKELIGMTTDRDELDAIAIGLQEDLAHWHGKYFDLVKENKEKSKIKDASENKVNLSQSEIDFLKSYLSQCLTEAAEDISLLKGDAKYYKSNSAWAAELYYKKAQKLKKKVKVLSGIQHKLKKTVLNRNVQSAPQVNQEGYEGHKQAWIAVCDAIEVYFPKFLSESGTGIELAVRAVHTLGKTNEQWNKLQNELQNIMTLNLKGIK